MAEQKKPKTLNLSIPEPLAEMLDEVCKREGLGQREKWIAASAALLMLATLPPEWRAGYIDVVRLAGRSPEKLRPLVAIMSDFLATSASMHGADHKAKELEADRIVTVHDQELLSRYLSGFTRAFSSARDARTGKSGTGAKVTKGTARRRTS